MPMKSRSSGYHPQPDTVKLCSIRNNQNADSRVSSLHYGIPFPRGVTVISDSGAVKNTGKSKNTAGTSCADIEILAGPVVCEVVPENRADGGHVTTLSPRARRTDFVASLLA